MFPPIEYLEWIAGRPERVKYDLGSSDLRAARPPVEGTTNREDPVSDLESLLAAEYEVDPEQILVTAGATNANFVAFATAIDTRGGAEPADDEIPQPHVLVEKPGYEPLRATPVGLGANVDRFVRPPEERYPLQADRVAAAAIDDTSLVVVTNRHNPSGVSTNRSTLEEVARAAEDAGATLLVDEVYAPFDLEPYAGGAFGGPTAAGLPNTVITSSVTKFFGLGPLRIGWLVGPTDFIARARSVAWHVPAVSPTNAAIVADVLDDATVWADRSRDVLATNYDLLASFVSDRSDLDGFVAPGCPYAFLSHVRDDDGGIDGEWADDRRTDGDRIVEAADEQGLLVVPGRFFDAPERFRVSLGGEPDEMREALAVLDGVLDSV